MTKYDLFLFKKSLWTYLTLERFLRLDFHFRPKTLQEKQLCLKLLEILWKPVGKGYLKVVFFAILHHRNIYPNSNAPLSQLFENCSIKKTMSFHAPNFLFAVKVHPRKAGKDRSSQLYFMVQPDDLT